VKILLLAEYPPMPAGLATQGDLLFRGLQELGVDARAVHLDWALEKEWYYRWFRPDIALGIGYWGYAPNLILHPRQFGIQPVPWLVADGFIANYREELNALPLILLTSSWVRDVYIRDGIRPDILEVLPVGCDTDAFLPREPDDPQVAAVRDTLGITPDQLLILTIGGDGASKGAREVMRALARIDGPVPDWRYVIKVWPQTRTDRQIDYDLQLAQELGIADKVVFAAGSLSRNCMPYLMAACDIYAGPSRLEGFGMPHVEAGACGKPVIAINAMAFLDTQVHGETGLLAGIAKENVITEATIYDDAGDRVGRSVILDPPRIADYRASVDDIAEHLLALMRDAELRRRLGEAGRRRVVERFHYRTVARQFLSILTRRGLAPAEAMAA
jgi:glycosyltransferase involved in cell wall biosynthesis